MIVHLLHCRAQKVIDINCVDEMRKSVLLDKILEKAQGLFIADGKGKINTDYFILATLSCLSDNALIEEVNEAEWDCVKSLCGEKFVDFNNAYAYLSKKVEESGETFMAGLLYKKAEMSVYSKAMSLGKDEMTADLFLEAILAEPTDNISDCISTLSGQADLSDCAVDTDKTSRFDDISSNEKGSGGAFPAPANFGSYFSQPTSSSSDDEPVIDDTEDADKTSDKTDKTSDENQLIELIKRVKKAQVSLLENVHGQDHAVSSVISGYYQAEITAMAAKERNKPKATFLFAGPPGVGKTFLAEQVAKTLEIPFMRFDMSEYADKESNIEFCGSDKVYKNAKSGNVTGFVAEHPKSILLFDEIEKAHLVVIHLFLQILDAGRIRDNFTDEEVSFSDTIIIFTTNAGRKLYEDADVQNLSAVSRKQVLEALSADINPVTNAPLFPTAICSRFAAGNVIMFNRLGAHDLIQIASREFEQLSSAFEKNTKIKISADKKVLYALLFAEGGNVDARTVRGRSAGFFSQETFELFRLMTSDEKSLDVERLNEIKIEIEEPVEEQTRELFKEADKYSVLIFASDAIGKKCKKSLRGIDVFCTNDIKEAQDILFNHDISLILCDMQCGVESIAQTVLNLEDVTSLGNRFFEYVINNTNVPTYVFEEKEGNITKEEVLSLMRNGARGVVSLCVGKDYDFRDSVLTKCNIANQQNKLLELARANKILSYKTKQKVSTDGKRATITLFDFKLDMAPDIEDGKSIISSASKPNVRFSDVIGAEDAKGELAYFVDYLKDPVTYMRRGIRAPKGILLYGPPGTGKTLLAKAMAGESDVTFIASEGNTFLKKFVGEGAEKVHELFRLARKYAPAVLFIDEIDAIGKDRGVGASGVENNSSDVLTAFLTEMDGFKTQPDKPVFVLAATNYDIEPGRGKSLDSALIRRFDRKILVDLPNKPEREKFIRLLASKNQNVSLSDEQIENVSLRSTNMSLADLESIFELALRDSIKTKDYVVNDECFENAFESYNSGEVKKWDSAQLERTARHESGHALLCWLSGETPSYLTIVARGSHGGYMQHAGDENKGLYTKEELLAHIRTSLAGRAAEVVYYGEVDGVSTGASGDLQSATNLAEQIICSYGMDEKIGLAVVGTGAVDSAYYSKIRDRINEILACEFEQAKKLISQNIVAMDKMVKVLMEKNHLKGSEIDKIFSSACKR